MSPRTAAENTRVRNESKAKIIATALELFANNGYHNTSISNVAKEAGVSKGLTYNYFESKEALLEAILHSLFQEAPDFTAVGEEMEKLSPKELLEYGIDAFFQSLEKDKKKWTWILSLSIEVNSIPRIKSLLTKGYKLGIQQIEEVLRLNGYENPALEAKLLAATYDGIAVQYVLFGDDYDILKVKDTLIKKYCT
jgi:AcrR family transcriptional regulator